MKTPAQKAAAILGSIGGSRNTRAQIAARLRNAKLGGWKNTPAQRAARAKQRKRYGYICPVCGLPIKEPQATTHTDDGLAHEKCTTKQRKAKI